MTFSNDINREVSKLKLSSKLETLLELSSILKTNASISIRNAFININFTTESEWVANRILKLLNYLYNYEAQLSVLENNNIMKNGLFNITIDNFEIVNRIMADSGFDILGNYNTDINILYNRIISIKEKGVSSYLRGIFLGSGSMVDPNKNYHIEFVLTHDEDVKLLNMVLDYVEIESLYKERKDKKIVYIKNSEMIANFLSIIKANVAMLELENVKVEKDLRNNINRRMNFDLANLNKTIETSLEQITDIEFLESRNLLPDNLVEIAQIRKENPELSLKEIGQMMKPKISKSSVAYKMKKIKELAKKFDK